MQGGAFFDTNVLLYALAEDDRRTPRADALLEQGGTISVQVLNEFAAVARRKLRLEWQEITGLIAIARRLCGPVVPLTLETHEAARHFAERYRLSFYDALIVATAQEAGCTTLWTEDLQDGQVIDRLTIRNPFS
jgi:predicted nucleic acid-binding protein